MGTSTRRERAEAAARLRAEGLTWAEIGRRLGVASSTASMYVSDPDLSRHKARLWGYGGRCPVCGGPRYADRKGAGRTCAKCAGRASAKWTRDGVVAAIREWEAEHGWVPTALDWHPALCANKGLGWAQDAYLRFNDGTGRWPHANTVRNLFGSWAAAVEAAGFPRPKVGGRSGPGRDSRGRRVAA